MPGYHLDQEGVAAAKDAEAERLTAKGRAEASIGDNYVRVTVFLAGVLFPVGIGSTFSLAKTHSLLIVAGLMLAAALAIIATQPIPPW